MIRYQLPYNHRQANDEISININPSILILWSITSACASPSSCWQIYSILSKTEAKKTSSDVKTSLVHHIVFAMILSQALIWSHGFLIPWLDPVTKIKWIFWRIELNEFIRIKLNGYKGMQLNQHRNIKLNGFKKLHKCKYWIEYISNYWILLQLASHKLLNARK